MVWMCLERCGETPQVIESHLSTIRAIAPRALTSVSFERYDLGEHSNLVRNPRFTDVYPALQNIVGPHKRNLRLFPMFTTVNIVNMRRAFENPDPLFQEMLSEARKFNYTGYNVDWEPEHDVVAADAPKYAHFLQNMASVLHKNGLQLNVDVASWTVLFNFTAISNAIRVNGAAKLNRMITMDTYAGSETGWNKGFDRVVSQVSDKNTIGIGLMTINPNDGKPLTQEQVSWRFGRVSSNPLIREIDIWLIDRVLVDINSYWWTQLEKFLKLQ